MLWFKHYNNLLSDSRVQIAMDKFGEKAPYAFMRLMEMMAEQFNPETPTFFLFSTRQLFTAIFPKCCRNTGKKILEFFQDMGFFKYKILYREIHFNCNLIKDLADEYTQKVLAKKNK